MGTFEAAQKAGKSLEKQVIKTKRQRRKEEQKSDKNKWLIQHPKIQSMDRREKIYVKDAGLNETKAEKQQAPIDPKLDLMSPEVKFGRILAGTDQRKRHAAVKKLKAYLRSRCDISEVVDNNNENAGGISELDLLKLWKALWYTLYMADKKPVQDELSKHICKLLWCVVGTEEEDEYAGRAYLEMTEAEEQELEELDDEDEDLVTLEEIENTIKAEMDSDEEDDEGDDEDPDGSDVGDDQDGDDSESASDSNNELDDAEIRHCRGAHLVSIFVKTFFRTIRRDWGSMDKYRIDKFYTLIRLMMHEVYEYMSARSWNYGIILLLNDAIFEEILKQPPNGLRYHLIDLCLEELAKVNAKAKIALTEATFLDVLEPFFGLCQTGRDDDTVQERVMEKVIDNFLENYCVVSEKALSEESSDDSKSESLIFDNVHVKTIGEFLFTLGSDPATKDRYRKSLYDLHKKYMRRLKKIGKDVDIATDEDGNEIIEEEDVSADDVTLTNIDESIRFLEAETDANRGERNNNFDDDMQDFEDPDSDNENEELEKVQAVEKPAKSKKKKKRKSSEPEPEPKSNTEHKKGKDRKKRTKKEVEEKTTGSEEEVVITLMDQQDARKKDRKAKKKLKKEQEDQEEIEGDTSSMGSKRVAFRKKNRAKSHKASMKALRTAEPPSTKETVPVKGILRKKPRHSSGNVVKKGRRKATSYF